LNMVIMLNVVMSKMAMTVWGWEKMGRGNNVAPRSNVVG